MVSMRDYPEGAVRAGRSVLMELSRILGEFRDHMVVVGGWVPLLLFESAKESHPGSLDVDLAVDFREISDQSYRTILEYLSRSGYRQDAAQPFRFFREIDLDDERSYTVEVDFLAGEYGGSGKGHRTQVAQDLRARKARGCDLVYQDRIEVTISGQLPGGAMDEVTILVAGVVPWIVMKGMALHSREKAKDAFDICYTIRNYPGGMDELVQQFIPHLDNHLVQEGLHKIRSKFRAINWIGPRSVADFLETDSEEAYEVEQRRAFEAVSEFLDQLQIENGSMP